MSPRPWLWSSLLLGLLAFGVDRLHKFIQISAECVGAPPEVCVNAGYAVANPASFGWMGGEYVRVTDFFDYVLVWNTGVSYGLLGGLPVWLLGILAVVAIVALGVWWWRTKEALVRIGLAICIGGALSNAVDRLLYGAVADFFHFHWQDVSFYIFNLADVAITLGVLLLVLDLIGIGRSRRADAAA